MEEEPAYEPSYPDHEFYEWVGKCIKEWTSIESLIYMVYATVGAMDLAASLIGHLHGLADADQATEMAVLLGQAVLLSLQAGSTEGFVSRRRLGIGPLPVMAHAAPVSLERPCWVNSRYSIG